MGIGVKCDRKFWGKLYKEEFHYLCYCDINTIRLTKWMRIWWAGHVARTEEWTNADSDVVVLLLTKKYQPVDRCRAVLDTTMNLARGYFNVSFNDRSFWETVNKHGYLYKVSFIFAFKQILNVSKTQIGIFVKISSEKDSLWHTCQGRHDSTKRHSSSQLLSERF